MPEENEVEIVEKPEPEPEEVPAVTPVEVPAGDVHEANLRRDI
jgi:hypothetical protein